MAEPALGIVPALADHGLDNTQIVTLTIENATLLTDDLPLPAQPLLRTQIAWRLLEGASPHDPLITGARIVKRAISHAARHGIPVDTSRVVSAKPDRWQQSTGVLLQDLP